MPGFLAANQFRIPMAGFPPPLSRIGLALRAVVAYFPVSLGEIFQNRIRSPTPHGRASSRRICTSFAF